MCGIFGIISPKNIDKKELKTLVTYARQRGRDSSGLVSLKENNYQVDRSDSDVLSLLNKVNPYDSNVVMGHSRLITNGLSDNQPVVKDDICLLHNGIIVNQDEVWKQIKIKKELEIDSEAIAGVALNYLMDNQELSGISDEILERCKGVIACALMIPKLGKLVLFSNNGSLYVGKKNDGTIYFSSENYPLTQIGCQGIQQVKETNVILDIPKNENHLEVKDFKSRKENLIPALNLSSSEEKLLLYEKQDLKRCTKCILPETMPFIKFDEKGVCNYCNNYSIRNKPRPKEEIFNLVESYRRDNGADCIVPFSGGRDSCYGLHLVIHELKMKPITYTYDWGMVTDLGRRNISRMCSELGVENIIIAADISKKRRNIRLNLTAWLKSPHLGMMALLTAGDKHFFRHVETVKKQTGVNLNLWGINPLEVTHFKAGFLGIKPAFEEKKVYYNGIKKQLDYHSKRFAAMFESLGYFNRSIWDTLSGEYYRSFTEKMDYYHIFDYWQWDEDIVESTLDEYDWERAPDTRTTWRIGDGTAAFYNYVYYTLAGFTEHDTFRSNQIREGAMTRERALELVEEENQPRYPNIRWYLDTLNMDYKAVINIVNSTKRLF